MLNDRIADRVKNATVKMTQKGGQGVLIPGEMILTAAHCIDWKCDGSMVLGNYFIEEIETRMGNIKATPLAVEPVADIAVLGALDNQVFPPEYLDPFEAFCENTEPVPLCVRDFPLFEPIPIFILTHLGKWVTGEAKECRDGADTLTMKFDRVIRGGTSGGPIVNSDGELLAICSNASTKAGADFGGPQPRPHLTMPVWLWQMVDRVQKGEL